MELREQLLLVEVVYTEDRKKVTLNFLDEERGELRPVNFNKQIYDNGKYVDNEEKAEKVAKWCEEILNTTFDDLSTKVGSRYDVYAYDRFNSLFEVATVEKFTEDMVGEMISTEIAEIVVDNVGIKIRYDYEGKRYESKMMYATYIESMKQFVPNPIEKVKKFEKFEEKFGVSVDKAQTLIGHPIIVEVKKAFGKNYWGDIKKFPKKKG